MQPESTASCSLKSPAWRKHFRILISIALLLALKLLTRFPHQSKGNHDSSEYAHVGPPADPSIDRSPPSLGQASSAMPDGSTVPGTMYDLQYIFAEPAEAAAICEYDRLRNNLERLTSVVHSCLSSRSHPGGSQPDARIAHEEASKLQSLATEELLAFQDAWPHLDFPRILQLLREAFPSHFDNVSRAAAHNHGPYPIS